MGIEPPQVSGQTSAQSFLGGPQSLLGCPQALSDVLTIQNASGYCACRVCNTASNSSRIASTPATSAAGDAVAASS